MITADQLVCHAVGDYVLQSDWMAAQKATGTDKGMVALLAHVITYTLPFLFVTQNWRALAWILSSHFFIDRYRMARFAVYAKNFMAPRVDWKPWSECDGTGYPKERPPWMAVWLYILADNTLHVICNGLAIWAYP